VAHFAQKLYRRCGVQGTVISKERPTGPVYEFSVKDSDEVAKMLALFGHTGKEPTLRIRPENFKCQNCMQAFIATAFLCCGTMTDPEKSYNLEFLSTRHYLSQQLEAMLAEHNFHPHRALRKGANTIYIKAADHIEDLLTFMGAGGAAMRIMDQRMYNEMRNKTNRLSNCETANISKSVNAAVQVQLAIEKLQAAGALNTLPAGTYTIKCAENGTSMEMHLVNDACGVEIYEDLSAYDAADSGLDDVPLPAGTVLFLSGNNALYFRSSNAQVDDLSTDTVPNPVTDDISYTLSDSEDSLYLLVGEDIEPGVYDVTCTAGSGYFAFDLPMENTRTMYCSAWLYGDDTYQDTLHHIVLAEGTELTLSNYNDMGYTVMFQPSETVYTHE